jgi:hypothetical protein
VRAVAEQMLEKVAQVDALLAAIADTVDTPPPSPVDVAPVDPAPVDAADGTPRN